MNATTTYRYQVSDHGRGRYSVQCYGGTEVLDETLIKDVNGWRRLGSEACFRRPEELAAVVFAGYAGITLGPGDWLSVQREFRDRV